MVHRHLELAERDPTSTVWGPRLIVRSEAEDARTLVGEAGFHGRPDADGDVEFGYMVLSEYRRRGVAEQAASALLAWAAEQPDAQRVWALVDPDNKPSLRLLHKLGFTATARVHHDERGVQFQLCRRLHRGRTRS